MANKRSKSTPSGMTAGTTATAEDRKARRAEAVTQMKKAQAARERRSRLLMAGGVVVALLVIVAAVVVVSITHKSPANAKATTTASSAVVSGVSSVPSSVFDTIGYGTAQAAPQAIGGGSGTGAGATGANGLPRVLYVGAEYCPFCAAERWALATALARFGTWSGLGETFSSASDVYPSTPTLSFHGATLDSKYVDFTGYETTTNQREGSGYKPLDKVPSADDALANKYGSGSIPFVYVAGRYASSGAAYSPDLLKGMTQAEIAKSLSDPSSAVAKAVDGSANLFTAAICQSTDNQPSNVCTSTGVQTALKAMQQASKSGS